MYSADQLLDKMKEIEDLIRDNKNTDGSFKFNSTRVMVSLELARRLAANEDGDTDE